MVNLRRLRFKIGSKSREKTISGRRYTCKECGKTFTRSGLLAHRLRGYQI